MASKVADALVAPIVVQYQGKGAKDAEKSLLSLDGVAKKLGKTFIGLFAAEKIAAFGKASVSAYIADEKAANSLAQTLSNMGLAIQSIGVEKFIQNLQNTTGVLDDQLRPAFQSLVTATNDVSKAQDLLGLALDISAGSTYDLATVTQALAKAQSGNTTQLSRMTLGITKAEYATKNFAAIQQKLTDLYKGDAAKAAETYAGKLAKVNAAVADMKEQIGKGLIDAFQTLSGSGSSIDNATTAIRNFGAVAQQEIAGLAVGIKQLGTDLANIPILGWLIKKSIDGWNKALGVSDAISKDIVASFAEIQRENTKKLEQDYKNLKAQNELNKKIEKDRIAAINQQNKALKDKLALERASSALKQADKIFDMQAIEIAAAMANKQTQEDMARLQLKKDLLDLQAAIDAKDVQAATALADKVNQDVARLNALRATSTVIDLIKNPFESWADYLARSNAYLLDIINSVDKINQQASKSPVITAASTTFPSAAQQATMYAAASPETQAAAQVASTEINSFLADLSSFYADLGVATNPTTGQPSIVVNVAGSVTTQQDLVDAITAGLQENSASGVVASVNRAQQWWATVAV